MAGPFHYDLRWDAAGEGKADECSSGCVGSDEFVFRVCVFYSFSCTVAYDCYRLVEFAEVLEVVVHLLVRDDQQW